MKAISVKTIHKSEMNFSHPCVNLTFIFPTVAHKVHFYTFTAFSKHKCLNSALQRYITITKFHFSSHIERGKVLFYTRFAMKSTFLHSLARESKTISRSLNHLIRVLKIVIVKTLHNLKIKVNIVTFLQTEVWYSY